MLWAQWTVLVLLSLAVFGIVAMQGQKRNSVYGFADFIIIVLEVLLFFAAGTFSKIFP